MCIRDRKLQGELLPYVIQVNEVLAANLSPDEVASVRHLLEQCKNNLVAAEVDEAGELRFSPKPREEKG